MMSLRFIFSFLLLLVLAKKDDDESIEAFRDLLLRDLEVSFKNCVSCKKIQILGQGF
jgi:hypothetical protein